MFKNDEMNPSENIRIAVDEVMSKYQKLLTEKRSEKSFLPIVSEVFYFFGLYSYI